MISTSRFLSQNLITKPDELRPEAKKIFDDVREFIKEEVAPLEEAFMAHSEQDGPEKWQIWQPIEVKISIYFILFFRKKKTKFHLLTDT